MNVYWDYIIDGLEDIENEQVVKFLTLHLFLERYQANEGRKDYLLPSHNEVKFG